MADAFKNPANGYVEFVNPRSWLFCLLFGPIYFAYKGIWTHVFLSIVLAPITLGVSWLIYPFFVNSIIKGAFSKNGWIEETHSHNYPIHGFHQLLSIAILVATMFPLATIIISYFEIFNLYQHTQKLNLIILITKITLFAWWFFEFKTFKAKEKFSKELQIFTLTFLTLTLTYSVTYYFMQYYPSTFSFIYDSDIEFIMNLTFATFAARSEFLLIVFILQLAVCVYGVVLSFRFDKK